MCAYVRVCAAASTDEWACWVGWIKGRVGMMLDCDGAGTGYKWHVVAVSTSLGSSNLLGGMSLCKLRIPEAHVSRPHCPYARLFDPQAVTSSSRTSPRTTSTGWRRARSERGIPVINRHNSVARGLQQIHPRSAYVLTRGGSGSAFMLGMIAEGY